MPRRGKRSNASYGPEPRSHKKRNSTSSNNGTNNQRRLRNTSSNATLRTHSVPSTNRRTSFSITCYGCDKVFFQFKDTNDFIKNHCLTTADPESDCRKSLLPCHKCQNLFFYKKHHREKHFKKSKVCEAYHNEYNRMQAMSASEVQIVHPSKSKKMKGSTNQSCVSHEDEEDCYFPFSSSESFLTKGCSENMRSFKPKPKAPKIDSNSINNKEPNQSLLDATNNQTGTQDEVNLNDDSLDDEIQQTFFHNSTDEDDNGLKSVCDSEEEKTEEDMLKELDRALENGPLTRSKARDLYDEDDEEDSDQGSHCEDISGNKSSTNDCTIIDITSQLGDQKPNMFTDSNGRTFSEPIQIIDLSDEFHLENIAEEVEDCTKSTNNNKETLRQYKESLECIHLMMSLDLPFSKYDTMMNFKHGSEGKLLRKYLPYPEAQQMAISKVYGNSIGNKLKPQTTSLKLPSGRYVDVVTYDIGAIIYDLLSDNKLTNAKNLIFQDGDEQDPFRLSTKNYYGDFDTSEYYVKTAKKIRAMDHNANPCATKKLEVPIVLYWDETNLDAYSKLTLHPLTMTFMMYNRKTRSLERAWRTLGYLPNLQGLPGSKSLSAEAKLCDHHFVLKYILSGLRKLQSTKFFYWKFKFPEYPGKEYERRLFFPLGLVIGDGKGSDTSCGRYQSRNKVKHICRDCNVLFEDSDEPGAVCSFLKMKDLLSKNKEELNRMCFHKIEPFHAFEDIDFGENPYGINGCTPPDNCHQINKGIVERLPEIFFARLNKKMVQDLDVHCAFISKNLRRQSDRSVPSIRQYRNGLQEAAKLTSDENIGRIFAIYLTILTRDFEKKVVNKKARKAEKGVAADIFEQSHYNKWVHVFEQTLILYSWVYLEKHPKAFFKGGKNSEFSSRMKVFMTTFAQTAKRKKGTGLKLMKFHQLLHLGRTCRMFGALPNVDSARNESHHKKKKRLAEKTQCRFNLLDAQTASNEFNFNLFLNAMKKEGMEIEKKFEMDFEAIENVDNNNDNNIVNQNNSTNYQIYRPISNKCKENLGSRFKLTFDYVNKRLQGQWISKKMKRKPFHYHEHILNSIYQKYNGYNDGDPSKRIHSFSCFTEFRNPDDNSEVFRCCPNYRNEGDWFDWALVRWEDFEDGIEAQLLIFIDLKTIAYESSPEIKPPSPILTKESIVLTHSISQSTKKDHRNTAKNRTGGPQSSIASFATMENKYNFTPAKSIRGVAYVIQDNIPDDATAVPPGKAKHVISIMTYSKWNKFFLDSTSENFINDAGDNEDLDLQDPDNEVYDYEG